MKTMTKTLAIAFALTVALTGCQKEVAGPKGDTGAAGAQGPAGTNGTNGTNGVANIMSYTLNTTPGGWTHIGTSGTPGDAYMATFSVPALTSNIIAGGAVMVYFMNGSTIGQLPLTVGSFANNGTTTLFFDASSGIVRIYSSDSDFYTVAPAGNADFKLVIIPPAFIKNNPDVNWNNYQEVKNKFNLQD